MMFIWRKLPADTRFNLSLDWQFILPLIAMLTTSTSAATVYRYHRWPGDDNCVPPSLVPWTVSGQELLLVVARSECAALRCGTLFRQNCVLLPCAQTLSAKKLKTYLFKSSY